MNDVPTDLLSTLIVDVKRQATPIRGATLVDPELFQQNPGTKYCDDDFWGSSIGFDDVVDGRIFGVFGVAANEGTQE